MRAAPTRPADDLSFAVEESRWCGPLASLTFSIANVGLTDHVVAIPRPVVDQVKEPRVWRGIYRLAVGRQEVAREALCQASDGPRCVVAMDMTSLARREAQRWRVPSFQLATRETFLRVKLSVDVRVVFGEEETFAWSGLLQLSKTRGNCWRATTVPGAHSSSVEPRAPRACDGCREPNR